MERGYYETLLDVGRRLDQLDPAASRSMPSHTDPAAFDAGPLALVVPDVREFVLKPNLSADVRGARWTTNAIGMRDMAYSRSKPADTIRIAFLGDSIGSGWGVDDGQGFEPTLELRLDARSRAEGGLAVQILNFAVPGHAPGQRWEDFTRADGWSMEPDLILYEATPADPGWDERRLRALLARGLGADAPVYRDVVQQAAVKPFESLDVYKRKLRPFRLQLLEGVYRTIARDARAHHVPAVWVLIPRVGKPTAPEDRGRLLAMARRAGFTAVLDLSDAYERLDATALAIAPNDFHPNAVGHARLADRLEAALDTVPEAAALWSDKDTRVEAHP
jgi:hypothetical protein